MPNLAILLAVWIAFAGAVTAAAQGRPVPAGLFILAGVVAFALYGRRA
jgi:hypothetical protein